MMKKDCIYYEDKEKDTKLHHCKHSHSLYDDNDDMCKNCRLWDAYIPNTSTKQQIEYVQRWQNMPLEKQTDYEEYFND